jgi:hypothetical protein
VTVVGAPEEVRSAMLKMLWLVVPVLFLGMWWMRRSKNQKARPRA